MPEVDEVRLVNAAERLRQHSLPAKVHRCQRRVLPARALPIVDAGNDEAALLLLRPLHEARVSPSENVVADGWDVAARPQSQQKRQSFPSYWTRTLNVYSKLESNSIEQQKSRPGNINQPRAPFRPLAQ